MLIINYMGSIWTGLRFFTVYGPFGRPDMAPFKFLKKILEEDTLEVYNNGNLKRDFTYIDDIVNGIISSLEKNFPYEIFNLGRGETICLLDFISEIEILVGKKAIKKLMPSQKGDVIITKANISKAKKLLNYDPCVSVREGMKSFIDWYISFYGREK